MTNRPIHFDMHSLDAEATQDFFADVFGWSFMDWPGKEDYVMVSTGSASEEGLDGGLMDARDNRAATTVTIEVEQLDRQVSLCIANGAMLLVPRTEIPGVGYVAFCEEPGGIRFGMIERADPDSGST